MANVHDTGLQSCHCAFAAAASVSAGPQSIGQTRTWRRQCRHELQAPGFSRRWLTEGVRYKPCRFNDSGEADLPGLSP
jgi:hypothetical protein